MTSQPSAQPKVNNPQHDNGRRYDHPILQMEARDREFTDKPMRNAVLHRKIFYRYFFPTLALNSSRAWHRPAQCPPSQLARTL